MIDHPVPAGHPSCPGREFGCASAKQFLKNTKIKTSCMIKRSALRRLLNNAPSFHSGPSFNLGSIHHDHADLIAEVLQAQGVQFFPVRRPYFADGCKRCGLRVIETRPRLSSPLTPWPGVTITITAVKNAQMVPSPVVLIGGAAPTALKGRGALQDLDPLSLFKSMVKWSEAVRRVKDLGDRDGVPQSPSRLFSGFRSSKNFEPVKKTPRKCRTRHFRGVLRGGPRGT